MKLVKLSGMPVAYMMRHWMRWYYVDFSGNIMPLWEAVKKIQGETDAKT